MRWPVLSSSGLMRVIVGCLLIPWAGWAQFREARAADLRGQIQDVKVGEPLQVELRGLGPEQMPRRALVGPTGDFQFESLPLGDYQLRVTDFSGNVLHEELVSIDDGYDFLTVRLPRLQGQHPVSGVVSVRQLQQKVPPKALREFSKARHELEKRSIQKSIASFQRAVAIYPGYAEAHNQLGFCYTMLKKFDQAAAAFQKAAELAPDAPMPKHNLGVALYALQHYTEAEQAARLALKLDPNLPGTHFLLGMSLHAQKRDGEETLENLRRAARQIPKAHLTLASILVESGHKSEAASELQQYLRDSDDPANRYTVESWLASLGDQTAAAAPGAAAARGLTRGESSQGNQD